MDDDGTEASAADTAVTTVTASADLGVDKRLVSDALIAGEEGTYELVVTNDGPSTAASPVVVDTLPDGLTAKRATGDGWTCTVEPALVTCERAELAPDATSTITVVVDVSAGAAGTKVTNVVDVGSKTPDPEEANNHDEQTDDIGASAPKQEEQVPPVTPQGVVNEVIVATGRSFRGLLVTGFVLTALGALVLFGRRFLAGWRT